MQQTTVTATQLQGGHVGADQCYWQTVRLMAINRWRRYLLAKDGALHQKTPRWHRALRCSAASNKNNCEPRTTTGGRVFISLRAQLHFPKTSSIGGSANQMRRTLKTWILGLDEFSSSSIQHLNSSHSETQQQLQRKTNKRCWQTESCVL